MRILIVFTLTLSLVFAGALPTAAPEQNGLSGERLNRINTVMRGHVEAGRLAGAPGLIARTGKAVFHETWGEMKPDTIVPNYSMTKAVTGLAALILYREGRVSLNEPVAQYIP